MNIIARTVACVVLLAFEIAAQQTFTLAEIEKQISSFQLSHGQTAAGGTAAGPPSKCSLAVCPPSVSFSPVTNQSSVLS